MPCQKSIRCGNPDRCDYSDLQSLSASVIPSKSKIWRRLAVLNSIGFRNGKNLQECFNEYMRFEVAGFKGPFRNVWLTSNFCAPFRLQGVVEFIPRNGTSQRSFSWHETSDQNRLHKEVKVSPPLAYEDVEKAKLSRCLNNHLEKIVQGDSFLRFAGFAFRRSALRHRTMLVIAEYAFSCLPVSGAHLEHPAHHC